MKNKLNCRQVAALINFYNEGCLTDLLTKCVEEHLDICTECREKYYHQDIGKDFIEDSLYINEQYLNFKNNLSAYVDNELDNIENIKIKKTAIQNPQARQDLEDMYNLKKVIHTAYEKTKNDFKTDLSRNMFDKIVNKKQTDKNYLYKLAAAFFVMIIFLLTGLIKFLHL
mgnify:CR=1 FL=1